MGRYTHGERSALPHFGNIKTKHYIMKNRHILSALICTFLFSLPANAKIEIQGTVVENAIDHAKATSPTTKAAEAATSSPRKKIISLFDEQMKIINEDWTYPGFVER